MKGLEIVSDFGKLQLLSNKYAFRILKELQKQPLSGVQLAEMLGIKTPRVIYYLKKLEKFGLAKLIDRKPVRGNREKFYCAIAQDFLISAGLDEMHEPESGISTGLSNSYLDYFLNRDLNLDLDEFARVVLFDYLKVQPGKNVVINFEEQNMGIYKKIVSHLRRSGINYRTIIKDPVSERDMLMNLPEKEIIVFFNGLADTVNWADAWIHLKRSVIPDMAEIPKERLDFVTRERKRALRGITESSDTRSILISIPKFEEAFYTDPDILENLTTFWKAASVNGDEFKKVSELAERMRDLDNFTIRTGQTDVLNVRVDRTKCFIDAGPFSSSGGKNLFLLPSGEISFVPYLSGLSGTMYMDHCELDCAEARGIELRVENGIVTDCRIEHGDNRLEEYFRQSDSKGRTISQIGFGLNPAARSMSYIPRLDTKVFGSFHVTFGSNLALGGDISGYTNWDIITEKPEVSSSGEIILNNGKYYV